MISRTPVVAYMPIAGQYRYRDLVQLIPAKPEYPRPSSVSGLYGGTLAVSFDDQVAPERPEDRWAHDHRERARIAYLTSKVDVGKDSQEWLQAVRRTQQIFSRRMAIEREAVRLLQVLTNSTLQRPQVSGHNWYLDRESGKAVFAQNTSPSFVTDEWGAFWTGTAAPIPIIDPITHFGRYGIGMQDIQVTLPSNLNENLDRYFNLAPHHKIVFSRACELFGNAQEIWLISRSLSLVSHVFALEALCHVDDPEPERCPDCHNLRSDQICSACGGPRFGLTRRFKEFVGQYIEGSEDLTLATRLYLVRSNIAHRGELLRADEFDPGFNVGGHDDQSSLERDVARTVRKILLGWLSCT
jgi:hypothetical protein